ncbi:SDR family NAD(P)-dependent oxidoreductase [Cognatilysobacter lacus]|uniref:Glucose 1-dehydrogenase n=1 Tax=Cognatilysobacter lacus TaxID=1643323 RepID=A0A5D8Z5P1_9GAMM|nr:glucose 1-dehydrogenase [Lysobacter lacus]TZF90017.1 glucose 1-dehydrogenase [Lysobacter lacus]
MDRVAGKTCVVTGGSMGIGAACVRRLAEEGAHVVVFDCVDPAKANAAAPVEPPGSVTYRQVDVTDEASVQAAMSLAAAGSGIIDVLVNNAGIAGANRPTHEITEAEWDRVQAVNVKGVFFCTKHAIPHMRANGGSIINLSSIYGLVGAPDVPPYHASKGAVLMMTRTDALLYAADRIRVNSVHPGYIWTPMVQNHLRESGVTDLESGRRDLAALHPLGRVGEPDDIAWGVVYLASDESAFMTGAQLVIDGGYTAR